MPRPVRTSTYLTFAILLSVVVLLAHASYFTMPPVWDEVPWPWGNWPPVPVVRTAVLLTAALTTLGAFLLAIELCGSLPGVPAIFAVAALAASPLFYMQSVLVLPAMPATLCATFGLWFAVRRRWLGVAVCAAVLAALIGFTAPLFHFRGGLPGYRSFAAGLARRLFVLFVADGHLVATAGLMLALSSGRLRRRRWAIAGAFCAAWFVLCLLCLPRSDRELLPILPVLFTAAVAGFHTLPQKYRHPACGLLLASLVAGLFWHPFNLPFPLENSLALGESADLHRRAAVYLEGHAGNHSICAAAPMLDELSRPELGYVTRQLNVTSTCTAQTPPDFYVRFSPYWETPDSLMQHGSARAALRNLLAVESPLSSGEVSRTFGLQLLTRMEREGQSVEIYGRYLSNRKILE
ncbi:MAG TPA: hypothetical protein VGK29_23500 [Paludibaculum sp.]|jgi:hypothetical protein